MNFGPIVAARKSIIRDHQKKKITLSAGAQYDHSTYITCLLSGREAPTFSPELLTKIREMFSQIQAPWKKTKPPDRSNFLNYNHCIYKMLELLGEDEHIKSLKLLKSSLKQYKSDQMWKLICAELNWQYIPTC